MLKIVLYLQKIRKKKRKALETAARQAEKDAEVLEKYRRKFEERLMRKSKGKPKSGQSGLSEAVPDEKIPLKVNSKTKTR